MALGKTAKGKAAEPSRAVPARTTCRRSGNPARDVDCDLDMGRLRFWATSSPRRSNARGSSPETEASHVQITIDRKSTRLNSSHLGISYAVFCLKKKIRKKY